MLFSSPRFFIFLLVTLLALALPLSVGRKKHALAALSCFFYAAWDWRYLFLLLAISLVDYLAAAKIDIATSAVVRRRWLVASVASNLAVLAYFKYTNFFIGTWNGVLGSMVRLPHADILLPAGISFYTFKSMSYTIDVYRRELRPCRSHLDYVTFITFFPELIAGPIVRASVLLPQMDRDIGPSLERVRVGASLFLVGLIKKLVVADRLATVVDPAFADPTRLDGPSTWLIVFAYSLQIYADFSGYSDMAIGTAKMIGYDLPENFDMPYASMNVTEFWRRWHITLSSWLRDYLYVPLGGNRFGAVRTYVNLMVTMLLGGLWHGASWNFVVWGGLHGAALAVHRALRPTGFRLPKAVALPMTFIFVTLCWVPFRSSSFEATMTVFAKLFGVDRTGVRFVPIGLAWIAPLVLAGHLLCLGFAGRGRLRRTLEPMLRFADVAWRKDEISGASFVLGGRGVAGAFLLATLVLVVFFFAELSANPFIYFQF
ncbi:MAG: MBOAT family protein [Labilithrix sp.]|nr:MBOAT family protein [Labilithrix sp.]